MSRIFTYVDEEDCGEVTCDIKSQYCSYHLDNPYLSISKNDSYYYIDVVTTVDDGWSVTLCVECKSISQRSLFKPFTIKQYPKSALGLN